MTALRSLTHATRYLDPARMRAWLRTAAVGDSLVYASGASLEGGRNPAAKLAREWIDGGQVYGKQKRAVAENGVAVVDYTIEKRAVGAVIHPAARQVGGEGSFADPLFVYRRTKHFSKLRPLFELLCEAAEAGADCPGLGALADALDMANRHDVRPLFNKLEEAGLVRTIEPARYGARVIEIVATGMRTRSQGSGLGGDK